MDEIFQKIENLSLINPSAWWVGALLIIMILVSHTRWLGLALLKRRK